MEQQKPVIQFVGYKNRGKTTLICRLIPKLAQLGLSVGVIKRDAHNAELDKQGSDTWQHREAGAAVTAITSDCQTALITTAPTTLDALIAQMQSVDFIFVEGFKQAGYPKIICVQAPEDIALVYELEDPVAVAAWRTEGLPADVGVPVLSIDDVDGILLHLQTWRGKGGKPMLPFGGEHL
ncbi:hypothetical protein SY83_21805 [Paenibacillus swuensis]|uniref:Molybdopterin-guanine dinucleotide biosynthesis protein B (MobB) domain-containing protein n=1 Tax=Paenibacillus swuensis TaxID=1178515 RepID=A0A172TN76_9BACL|nr:molybdopterin-guanine dinucleotide biosynthesis protein B [Paenibacillus swuensis]ANE48480.1 hypothetical protein SY83_21805 [Paenibacillus swuensis]